MLIKKKKKSNKRPQLEVFTFEKGVKNLFKDYCFLKIQFCP